MLTLNSQGLFSLVGIEGYHLTIEDIKANGYIYKNGNHTFYSDEHVPGVKRLRDYNAHEPYRLVLWKIESIAELEKEAITKIIVGDGRSYSLSLLAKNQNGKIANITEGDMGNIIFNLEKIVGKNEMNKEAWSFVMDFKNGGISNAEGEYDFAAPLEGYEPRLSISYHAGQENWKSSEERKFYFFTVEEGKKIYGLMKADIKGYGGPSGDMSAVTFSYKINPTGSNNLTEIREEQ